MLIVRRRPGQAILIGEQIEVHVLEITPARVKLGVVAPREISVVRAEVRWTEQANLAAAQGLAPEKLAELTRRLQEGGRKARRAGAPEDAATGERGESAEPQ